MKSYTALERALIKFIQDCIKKNKKYNFCDLTNKELAERFEYKKRKYSAGYINAVWLKVKDLFFVANQGRARQIFLSRDECITSNSYLNPTTNLNQSSINPTTNLHISEQESLEPVGIQDPSLSIKNQELSLNINLKKEKINKKENVLSKYSASQSSANYQYSSEFEEIWSLYGKTGSKKEAFAAFNRALSRVDLERLRSSIPLYLRSKTVIEGYKKHLSSWLNGDCWDSYWEVEKVETPEELLDKAEHNTKTAEFLKTEAKWAEIRKRIEQRKKEMGIAA